MKTGRLFQRIAAGSSLLLVVNGCAGLDLGGPASPPAEPVARRPAPTAGTQAVDPRDAERLRRIMVPLLRVMDHPRSPSQVQVSIVDDPHINAGSAGEGQFVVTTGLLRQANDERLLGVLAHEVAHDDLGHVARTQALGAGVNIATVLLDQIFPGSGRFTPIAGTLAIRAYSRTEEYEADRHGVELLRRLNRPEPKQTMMNTLAWLIQTSGSSGGGFLSTHPATTDRIDALRRMS